MDLTQQDMIDRFGADIIASLSDKNNHSVIDDDVVAAAITDATEIAKGYYNAAGIGGYVFDANTVAKMADIAMYRLASDNATELQKERRNEAIKWFEFLVNHPSAVSQTNDDDSDDKHNVHSYAVMQMVRG